MPSPGPAQDVSGRPLQLRDVDLATFLSPRTIAVIGASESGRRPNGAMTRKFKQWADRHGARLVPVHPEHATVLGERCYPTLAAIPADVEIDLAIVLTGRAVDTFEEVVQREPAPKFAVIFAAGFSETGDEGAMLEQRLDAVVRANDVRLLGPNTNLNA